LYSRISQYAQVHKCNVILLTNAAVVQRVFCDQIITLHTGH